MLKLIGLLQAGRGYNTEALSKACEVSRRTVFRDLDLLRQAGIPLVYNEDQQRYHIPGIYFLPPTSFTPDEALALILLCGEVGGRRQWPFFEPAQQAAMKLAGSLPERLREHLRSAGDGLGVRTAPANPLEGKRTVFDQLLSALVERRCVRIGYHSLYDDKDISTRLDPYHVWFSRRSWYVIGRASLYRQTRTFNLGRIRTLEILDDTYQIPRGFSLDRYLRNAWHLIPEEGPDWEVVVRFSRMVAQNVAEVAWHKTQEVKFHADGSMDFQVTVSGLNEISWWILGYGDQAEVLRPPELRRIMARHAGKLSQRYRAEMGDAG
jgi:predicted DNA-binding transcriptional regulator YafY